MDVLATPHWRASHQRLSNLEVLQVAMQRHVLCPARHPGGTASTEEAQSHLETDTSTPSLLPLERFPSPGCWPPLQALYRHGLRSLQIPEPLPPRLRQGLSDLQISDCPSIPGGWLRAPKEPFGALNTLTQYQYYLLILPFKYRALNEMKKKKKKKGARG